MCRGQFAQSLVMDSGQFWEKQAVGGMPRCEVRRAYEIVVPLLRS